MGIPPTLVRCGIAIDWSQPVVNKQPALHFIPFFMIQQNHLHQTSATALHSDSISAQHFVFHFDTIGSLHYLLGSLAHWASFVMGFIGFWSLFFCPTLTYKSSLFYTIYEAVHAVEEREGREAVTDSLGMRSQLDAFRIRTRDLLPTSLTVSNEGGLNWMAGPRTDR